MQNALDELEEVTEINNSLGKGSYGEVKLFRHKASGNKFAVKIIQKEFIQKHSSVSVLLREIQIHKNLKHENIVQMINCFEDEEKVYIVLEYVSKGNLFRIIRRAKGLSEENAWKYFTQTCLGIKYLHDNGIIHRDLKPENILIDEADNVKICDFGWCVQSNETRNTFCGTLEYMAPEMLQNKGHTYHVDLWALGILLYELIAGNAPFIGKSDNEKRRQILENKILFESKFSEEAKTLIRSLLKSEPNERVNINQVLASSWVQKYAEEAEDAESMNGLVVDHPELGLGEVIEQVGLVCMVRFGEQFSVLALNDAKKFVELPRVSYSGIEKEAFESLEKWCGKSMGFDKSEKNGEGMKFVQGGILAGDQEGKFADDDGKKLVEKGIGLNGLGGNVVKVMVMHEDKGCGERVFGVFDMDEVQVLIDKRTQHSKMRQRGFGMNVLIPKISKNKDLYSRDSTGFQEVFNLLLNVDVSDAALRNREDQLEGLRKTLESAQVQRKARAKAGFWSNWFGCLDR